LTGFSISANPSVRMRGRKGDPARQAAKLAGAKMFTRDTSCIRCGGQEFYTSGGCTSCTLERMFAARARDPEHYRELDAARHRRNTGTEGLPPTGVCECCGHRRRLVPDHDHNLTGPASRRGRLCQGCNTGIGLLGDSILGVRRALDYLGRFYGTFDCQPMG
jgi:hypothetical protein